MKKLLTLLLVMCLVCLLPLRADATSCDSDGHIWKNRKAKDGYAYQECACGNVRDMSEDGSEGWELIDGVLTVTCQGPMFWHRNIDKPEWYPWVDEINKIVMHDGLTVIGNNMFSGCSNLTEVVFPETLTKISYYAFCDCTSLEKIVLPAGFTEWKYAAFIGCTALKEIHFQGKVCPLDVTDRNDFEGITADCYYCCSDEHWQTFVHSDIPGSNLTWIVTGHDYEEKVIAPTCTKQGYTIYTCVGCNDRYEGSYVDTVDHNYGEEVVAPTCDQQGYTLYTCVDCGFSYQDNYTDTIDHNYVEEIIAPTCYDEGYTLVACTMCDDEYYTNKVPRCHDYDEFNLCRECNEPKWDEHGIASGKVFDLTWTLEKSTLTISGNGTYSAGDPIMDRLKEQVNEVIIESGVTLGDRCFAQWEMSKVTIRDGVTTIGDLAFNECEYLESVTLGNDVESIGAMALRKCENLYRITIPASVRNLGYRALDWNPAGGVNVYFQGSAPKVGGYNPISGKKVTPSVFSDTEKSNTVHYPFDNTTWTQKVQKTFGGNTEWMPNCDHAWSDGKTPTCSNCGLKPTVIASGKAGAKITWNMTEEGTLFLYGSGKMDDYFRIDEDGTEYFGEAPWSDYIIQEVYISNGITTIGDSAFCHMDSLHKITLPSTLVRIGRWAFMSISGGPSATDSERIDLLVIPEGTKEIDDAAFSMAGIAAYSFPSTLEKTGSSVINRAGNIDIYIPSLKDWFEIDHKGGWHKTFIDHLYVNGVPVTDMIIPEGITTVDGFFPDMSFVTSIHIPKTVTRIEAGAFAYEYGYGSGSKLKEISFPASVEYIGTGALSCQENLKRVFILNPECEIATTYYDEENELYYEGMFISSLFMNSPVIYGYSGSTAETYAEAEGFEFVALDKAGIPVATISNVNASGKLRIEWNKVKNAAKYQVYISENGGAFRLLSTTTGTRLNHGSAVVGKTYRYYVTAILKDGSVSEKSNIVTGVSKLAQPVVTMEANEKTGKTVITWSKVKGAKGYAVYFAVGDSMEYTLLKNVKGTKLNHNSVVAGTKYRYKVMALCENEAGNSVFSSSKNRTADLARPDVTVKRNSKGKPSLDWQNIEGAKSYKVYIYNKSGKLLKTVTAKNSKLVHSSASKNTTYTYQVEAIHAKSAANSAKSVKVTIKSK